MTVSASESCAVSAWACSPRGLVALATLGSAAVLGGAFIFQALGYAPCHLCLLQRWPHAAAIGIGVLMLVLRLPGVVALLGALAALSTAGLGVYHSLVERHLITGPTTCTSSGPGSLSASDLLAQIQSAPLVQCDQIAWEMFGVTMPNLNALFSLIFAGLWIAAYLRSRQA